MTDCAVLIPVLNRPGNAQPVTDSILGSCDATIVFVATANDRAELRALRKLEGAHDRVRVLIVARRDRGDYARKINDAVNLTSAGWLFQGADDLRFPDGWLTTALDLHAVTGARVIGFPDGCNPRTRNGNLSTHNLVARTWVEEIGTTDRPGVMLHEGYWHNFVDEELVLTAKQRRGFAFARDVTIRHLHPQCGDTPVDATYERALDRQRFAQDRRLLRDRQRMFWRAARDARRRPVPGRRHVPR